MCLHLSAPQLSNIQFENLFPENLALFHSLSLFAMHLHLTAMISLTQWPTLVYMIILARHVSNLLIDVISHPRNEIVQEIGVKNDKLSTCDFLVARQCIIFTLALQESSKI